MTRVSVLVVIAGVLLAPSGRVWAAENYETLLKRATEVYDQRAVLLPFVKSCHREKTSFRKLFCEALNERLKAQHQSKLYSQTFETSRAGPLVVEFSEGDQPKMKLAVQGCLTCDKPMFGRKGGDAARSRFFVFREPKKIKVKRGGKYELADIAVGEVSVALKGKMSAKKFKAQLAPQVRLDVLYRPVAGVTRIGRRHRHGVINFELVGHRLYNKCTGEVYRAVPAMAAKTIKVDKNDMSCPQNRPKGKVRKVILPPKLPEATVKRLMAGVSEDLVACYNQFGVTGDFPVDILIMANGKVKQAQVMGKKAGSPAARCVERLVKNTTFPKFSGRALHLPWPFSIEDK